MAVIGIRNPKIEVKKMNFDRLEDVTDKRIGVIVKGNEIIGGYSIGNQGEQLPFEIEKAYSVNDTIWAFAKNGKIYKKSGYDFIEIMGITFGTPPEITAVTLNGESRTVCFYGDKCVILEDENAFIDCIKGENFLEYKNNLFCIVNGMVCFIGVNQFYNAKGSFKPYFLGVDGGKKVIKLFAAKNSVIAFTEGGAYQIKSSLEESDFEIKEIAIFKNKIHKNSIKFIGEEGYFLDVNGNLFKLENERVTHVLTLDCKRAEIDNATSFLDNYLLKGKFDGDEQAYLYNCQKEYGYYIPSKDFIFVDGGIAFNQISNTVHKLKKQGGKWKSKEIFLDEKSHLDKVKYISSCDSEIKITGRFGSKTIYAGDKNISIKTNLCSNGFKFEITLLGNGKVSDFGIEYSE